MPRAGRATAAPPPAAGGAIKTTGPAAAPATAFHVAEKASVAFLFSICINQFYLGVTAYAPRTLGVYQVRDFFPDAREETIGPATGSLAAAFNFAQLATSFAWGWVADASGRPKLLILLANVVCGAGSTAFALTTTYGGAMASRVVAGAFMTSGVVMKALIGMTLSKNAQAVAMAARTLGAGLAQILTPLVIGQLANPCTRGWRVGGCGAGGFLATHPYALSGAFIAAVGVAATSVNFFMIPNVRTVHGVPVDAGRGGWPCARRAAAAAAAADRGGGGDSDGDAPLPASAASSLRPEPPPSAFSTEAAAPLPAGAPAPPPRPAPRPPPYRRLLSVPVQRTLTSSASVRAAFTRSLSAHAVAGARTLDGALSAWGRAGFAGGDVAGGDLDAARAAATGIAEARRARRLASGLPDPRPASDGATSAPADGGEAGAAPRARRWWRDRRALTSIVAYAATTFLFDSLMDTVSLYASAPHTAAVPGLSLSVQHLTWPQSLAGACIVAFSVLAYPPLQRAIGVARCATAGLAVGVPAALIPPLAYYVVPRGPAAVVGVLAAGSVVYGAGFAATSTSSQIMVNLCAPDGDIGAVNGAGNTLSAAARVVGPLAVGGLWSIAATDALPDQWLPFGVLAGGFGVTLGLYVWSGLKDE